MKLSPSQIAILVRMLTYCRPHGSLADTLFRDTFLMSLPGARLDAYDNIHVRIGESPILWSAHTDTVHRVSGFQTVHVADSRISLSKRAKMSGSSCLGADDTVGCFLLREMILRGIPGHYVFHYGEEDGGIGSSKIAMRDPDLVRGAQFAIALDRKGTTDVITHQQYGRTCSDAFARSLADQLLAVDPRIAPCDGGIYTDTAEYSDVIPECTNVSVGYYGAHTKEENVDLVHVGKLLHALCALDVSLLVCERDPNAKPIYTSSRDYEIGTGHWWDRIFTWEEDHTPRTPPTRVYTPSSLVSPISDALDEEDDDTWEEGSRATDYTWCRDCNEWSAVETLAGDIVCEECGRLQEPLTEEDRRFLAYLRDR